jgi:hypothetical protein
MMILTKGEKLHIVIRRFFEEELRRHFLGEVVALDQSLARLEGYTFIFDHNKNQYVRKPGKRIRLIGLGDPGLIINILPSEADLDNAKYTQTKEGILVVTDGKNFSLDINEFGSLR